MRKITTGIKKDNWKNDKGLVDNFVPSPNKVMVKTCPLPGARIAPTSAVLWLFFDCSSIVLWFLSKKYRRNTIEQSKK